MAKRPRAFKITSSKGKSPTPSSGRKPKAFKLGTPGKSRVPNTGSKLSAGLGKQVAKNSLLKSGLKVGLRRLPIVGHLLLADQLGQAIGHAARNYVKGSSGRKRGGQPGNKNAAGKRRA